MSIMWCGTMNEDEDKVYKAMQERRDYLKKEEQSIRDQINKLFVQLIEVKEELAQYNEEYSIL